MISDERCEYIEEVVYDDTLTKDQKVYCLSNMVSELEEEIITLRERSEDLEYDLGLARLENNDGTV